MLSWSKRHHKPGSGWATVLCCSDSERKQIAVKVRSWPCPMGSRAASFPCADKVGQNLVGL